MKDWGLWEKRVYSELLMQRFSASKMPTEYRRGGTIRVKSDVDFVFSIEGKAVWCDAKCTEQRVWNLKEHVFNPRHIHQWAKLRSVASNGDFAGYLIWWTKTNTISWVPVEAIEVAHRKGEASIHPETELVKSQEDDTQIHFRKLILDEN